MTRAAWIATVLRALPADAIEARLALSLLAMDSTVAVADDSGELIREIRAALPDDRHDARVSLGALAVRLGVSPWESL